MDFTNLVYKDFRMKRLGQGSQGRTYLATFIATNDQYAIKKDEYLEEDDKERVNREIEQMKRLESRFTVKLLGTFIRDDEIFLVMQLCSKGDLRKVISDLQKLPEKERVMQVWAIFGQTIRALDHLHSNSVVHRDIKPENIFVMEDGSICLGDFGFAKEITEGGYATMAGTKVYMASEIWLLKKTDYLSDIFSVGIVTQELLTGRHPYESGTEQATIERIKVGKPDKLPAYVPREMKELITAMLSHDANKRPTTKQIMEQDTIKLYLRIQEEKEQIIEKNEKQQIEIAQLKQQLAKQQPQSDTPKPKQQSISTQPKVTSQPKIIAQPPVIQSTVSEIQIQHSPIVPYSDDVKVDGESFTSLSNKTQVILFNPVIKNGAIKFELLSRSSLNEVGIAEESVRYGRDEYPTARGDQKVVRYWRQGWIKHISGTIYGNSNFRTNDRVTLELNMDSNPRTLTFYVNDVEQPHYIINIPAELRFYLTINIIPLV
ncbi:MAG: putative STE family protein kinase [Streblomastix strix]|uniref:non-specific serine/threonine protein kinase n=1 Tax=Streblomastix strix TaxID=222440 RepID=A0A5J4VZI9_9EUKA|nr:MAG: putative STE family protein kinase [Streblomastix strix]